MVCHFTDPLLWREIAGSENVKQQAKQRVAMLERAKFIVPGHGPMFQVSEAMIRSEQKGNKDLLP